MRVRSSYVFVAVVVAMVALYFVVRSLLGADEPAKAAPAASAARGATAAPASPPALQSVQAILVPEQIRPYEVVLRGRTEAARSVEVRAETSGVVAQAPVQEGAVVRKGVVLCRLAVDARQTALDQARAALTARQLQHQAALDLAGKGYRSPTQVAQSKAELDGARAAVRQAEIALDQVNIRAPFAGVFDRRDAEVGAYLAPGQSCGALIELDPILVVGDVPEGQATKLQVGAPARARLLSGEVLHGRVRYVARQADSETRTYRVEVAIANPKLSARSGLSADARVSAGQGPAHLAPVSALVLDADGRQGVRYLLADDRVAFAPVTVLEETAQGVWIAGLAGPVRLITVGQSYVAEGQKVRVAMARSAAAPRTAP